MRVTKKFIIGTLALGLSSISSLAIAQTNDEFQYSQGQDLNFQSKMTFRIPLGATDRKKLSHQTRLGLGVGLARGDFGSPFGHRYGQTSLNLLDVGTYGLNRPSLQFNNQEIYGPTFIALHADETSEGTDETSDDENKGPSTTLVLVGGALVAVGVAAVVVNEAVADLLVECIFNPARPNDCPD